MAGLETVCSCLVPLECTPSWSAVHIAMALLLYNDKSILRNRGHRGSVPQSTEFNKFCTLGNLLANVNVAMSEHRRFAGRFPGGAEEPRHKKSLGAPLPFRWHVHLRIICPQLDLV